MAEQSSNENNKKLDWMYRDSSQIVDREEYLLGRKIDKQFETSVLPPDKDQECLPPSLFSRRPTERQVDISRKLQEDPLYLIKKKEIECREQLLKNPRKMKQLQEMIARQQAAAEKLKRKQLKKIKKMELDTLLVKKCKKVFGGDGTKKLAELYDSDSETSSSSDCDSKSSKKKKVGKDLDRILALKYKKIIGKLDAKGLATIDCSSDSNSEDEREKKARKKKKRRQQGSSSDESDKKPKRNPSKVIKKGSERRRNHTSSEDDSEHENVDKGRKRIHHRTRRDFSFENNKKSEGRNREHSKNTNRAKQRESSSSSEGLHYKCDEKQRSKGNLEKTRTEERRESYYKTNREGKYGYKEVEREKHCESGMSRSERKERNKRGESGSNHKNAYNNKKSQQDEASSSSGSSSQDRKNPAKSQRKGKILTRISSKSDSSSDSGTKEIKSSKSLKQDKVKRKKESSTSSSSECSSGEKRQPPKKQYGLVLPANYVPKKQSTEEVKPAIKKEEETNKPYRKGNKIKLTDEEKERKLKEMMDNAKWRDEQRDKNIKAFKEKEKAEKDDYVYNEDFMRKQMAIAVSQGTVESRVKANINTIQRSGASMSEHFARRK